MSFFYALKASQTAAQANRSAAMNTTCHEQKTGGSENPREPMRYCCDWCVQVLAAAERWPCASASGHTLVVDTLQDQARPLRRSTMHLRRHATEILAHERCARPADILRRPPRIAHTLTRAHPATSAPGLGSPLPHPHRDWARPCHIRTRTCTGPPAEAALCRIGAVLFHVRPQRRRQRSGLHGTVGICRCSLAAIGALCPSGCRRSQAPLPRSAAGGRVAPQCRKRLAS